MRRSFAILLILFFGLGPLSATLEASDDASLPACCRRNGAHHCAMTAEMEAMRANWQQDSSPAFSAPSTCPYYPGAAAVLTGPAAALAAAAAALPSLRTQAYRQAAFHTRILSGPERTRAGRGPPAAI
ncbi:MAG TPA: hypothetical protein VHX20_00350 [Terracidiphilus sp.]|jgi:hypothetical protein|nr:hypothetical protein [Terracidiphilus sp.]